MRGEELFHQAGCAGCHIPELTTHHTTLPFSVFPRSRQTPVVERVLCRDLFSPSPWGRGNLRTNQAACCACCFKSLATIWSMT